jgi:hypothetical protein
LKCCRDAIEIPGNANGGDHVTKNVSGLIKALNQFINEAILQSEDVAAAMAALKRTGLCPVFTVDISLQEAPGGEPGEALGRGEQLVLSDADVEFLTALGISDPSWCCATPQAPPSSL